MGKDLGRYFMNEDVLMQLCVWRDVPHYVSSEFQMEITVWDNSLITVY